MVYVPYPEPQAGPSSSSSSRRSSPKFEGPPRLATTSSSSRKSSPGRAPQDLPRERSRYSVLEKLLIVTCVATLFSNVVLWVVGAAVAGVFLTRAW